MRQVVKQGMLIVLTLCMLCASADAKWPAVGSDVPGSTGQCLINDAGVVGAVACGAATGVAPADAKYIVQTASTPLTAEQSIGALTTGLLLNTVTGSTGVLTTYAAQACTTQFVRGLSASGVPTCQTVVAADIAAALASGISGHLESTGTTPALSGSCGTSPSVVGTDVAGKVTTGSVAPSSCVLTFATAWTNAPSCMVTNETTANVARAVSSTTVVTLTGTMIAGDVLSYLCVGWK